MDKKNSRPISLYLSHGAGPMPLLGDDGHKEMVENLKIIRKNREGAFWEDRYHVTAIEQNSHLNRCLIYVDLNMVRAGVVDH